MSPIRSPSPFETSADPGDVLLSASISLEGSAAESVPGPSVRSKLPRGEIILLKTEDLCPTEPNGKAASRVLADLLKRLADVGVKAVVGGVRALANTSLPVEDDSSSANPEEAGIGTFSIVLCTTKKAIFDDALAGLDSLSTSIYIKAFIDPGAGEPSVDDVMLRVEKAGLLSWEGCNGEQGDCGGDMREAVHDYANTGASGFVLINVSNDLDGEGQGFLQMQELDENDHNGDIDVCYSGTGF